MVVHRDNPVRELAGAGPCDRTDCGGGVCPLTINQDQVGSAPPNG
jgi:hypothetical protein